MSEAEQLVAATPLTSTAWRPPPFCRISWTSEAARSLWEPRLQAARDLIEDLAVLRTADHEAPRLLFARPGSLPRLTALAERLRVSLCAQPAYQAKAHDVAAGRAGRVAMLVGREGEALEPALAEHDDAEDPVWRLARQSLGTECFDDGRGLVVTGHWASNPMLAAIGLSATVDWPRCFDCSDAQADGEALLASAAAHGRDEAAGHLREALSWPVSWTALHGAAEVKTPLFRFVRNTPPTGLRLSVRRLGAIVPQAAARGLGFPFTSRNRIGDAA